MSHDETGRDGGADLVSDSRFLSYVLRHNPAVLGLSLDSAGWVDIEILLTAMATHGRGIGRQRLAQLVTGLDKPRLETDSGRIRASHGHSVDVDLGLEPAIPPAVLFHGTIAGCLDRIRAQGLKPMSRRHVHLSADVATARRVAARRGAPVILSIDTAAMLTDGHVFLPTSDQVWLTASVPPEYLETR